MAFSRVNFAVMILKLCDSEELQVQVCSCSHSACSVYTNICLDLCDQDRCLYTTQL